MLFNPFDAAAILKTPLSRRQVQDRLVWKFRRDGKFTMKSGYYVACRLYDDTNGREESSEQRHDHNIWKQLWQLHVPSKIKVFGWRACLNILPSKVNLVRRHVLQEDKWEICQRCSKSIIHALWDCGAAQDVWAGSVARIQKSGGKVDDFLQLFQVMMAKLSMKELEIFLVQSWLI